MTSFKYFYKSNSRTLDIILHGNGAGIDDKFIKNIFEHCEAKRNSVLALQMPYFERGDSSSSGKETPEEVETIYKFLRANIDLSLFSSVRIIGKSLGGIIASNFLVKHRNMFENIDMKLYILGYIQGDVNISGLIFDTYIIQGEFDKYGKLPEIKNELKEFENINHIEILGADHSYRNAVKEPVYQQEVIDLI